MCLHSAPGVIRFSLVPSVSALKRTADESGRGSWIAVPGEGRDSCSGGCGGKFLVTRHGICVGNILDFDLRRLSVFWLNES
mmetsp:Transcript_29969/g.74881  ORF Transcript_29969/g.74881 Transcript_29969/m.74881 type:complete len:81 (+) Transcript_29969:604-846(+)